MTTVTMTPRAVLAADPHSDSVLGKVRLILEAFHADDEAVTLAELTRRTGVPKATVYRICQELVAWGALERAGVGYHLGLRLFELGQRAARRRRLHEVAQPFLEELAWQTRETVHCAIRDGHDVLYIEKVGGHRQVVRPSRIGGRMPLHCTATGKVLLAYGPREVAEEVLAAPLRRVTGRTVVAPQLLRAELERIRVNGYAMESEETRVGYLSVAAPVFADGPVCAAVSVTAPTMRGQLRQLVPAVRAAASAISGRLQADSIPA